MSQEIDYTEVERLAAAGYNPKQVGFILGLKPSDIALLMLDEDSDFSISYHKGFYSSELSVRESIMMLAKNGSSPAQTLANKIFDDTRKSLLLNNFNEKDY